MSQQELLVIIIKKLDKINCQYVITGSTVSSIQGEPRSTHDIDIIISINMEDIDLFYTTIFEEVFYLEKEAIVDAVKNKTMFNLIDSNSGDNVDFWILTEEPFDISRFSRKQKIELFNYSMNITSCEDTILMKLKWAKDSGGSKKHYTDALRIYELNRDIIDFNYINDWVKKLEIDDLFNELIKEASL